MLRIAIAHEHQAEKGEQPTTANTDFPFLTPLEPPTTDAAAAGRQLSMGQNNAEHHQYSLTGILPLQYFCSHGFAGIHHSLEGNLWSHKCSMTARRQAGSSSNMASSSVWSGS